MVFVDVHIADNEARLMRWDLALYNKMIKLDELGLGDFDVAGLRVVL